MRPSREQLEKDLAKHRSTKPPGEHGQCVHCMIPGWPCHQSQILTLALEADTLADFKAYVHQRLDDAGIPTHPDGPHSVVGCRIGDRLDIVLAEADTLRTALEKEKRSEWREGIVNVVDHEGNYLGCMGVAVWAALGGTS